jgi:predicted Zn finger-like uncharacterized protein
VKLGPSSSIEESQMIIQCEKCQTKFRLDDSRVTEKGVKVRCTKCKHVFTVQKNVPDAESHDSESAVSTMPPPVITTPCEPTTDQKTASGPFSVAPSAAEAADTAPFNSDPIDFGSFDATAFDTSALSFETDNTTSVNDEIDGLPDNEPAFSGGSIDFSHIDFDSSETDSEPSSFLMPETVAPPASQKQHTGIGLDFSDDAMFGAVIETAPEPPGEEISFDFEDTGFAESMEMKGRDFSNKESAPESIETPAEAPFSLGEIDFGEELTAVAVQQVNPEDLKPSQQALFAPLAAAQDKTPDAVAPVLQHREDSSDVDAELPPLTITSRRKQSPFLRMFTAAIAIIVLSALGYFGYSSLSSPSGPAVSEAGKISINAVKSVFVKNSGAGELLVISGNALNEYTKPQASLQIKVAVFNDAGQSVAAKTAYCGNPLTEEQLKSLPLENIEAAMANQFGDSLANMSVAPGKSIPFVVVVANLPPGAKDFSVQSAGSTATSGK